MIGVGYLGRFHAQKYAQAAGCELVAVVDPRAEARDGRGRRAQTRARWPITASCSARSMR